MTKKPTIDIYASVTAKILAQLEAGARPWIKPWQTANGAGGLPLRHNGMPYQGVNVIMLWMAAADGAYESPYWMTYKQAQELGGNVRQGEKSTPVVFMKRIEKIETNSAGEDEKRAIFFARQYHVFNVDQIDGVPERYRVPAPANKVDAIKHAECFVAATGADVRHGGGRAFFQPGNDYIAMPERNRFDNSEGYYATLFHELTHWSGAEARLDRLEKLSRFGSEKYAFEELVAEIGASFLCAIQGIENEVREDHASYIQSWIKVLKGDKRAFFKAATLAQKASDYLLAFQVDEAANVAA